jgi:hypothetical protein
MFHPFQVEQFLSENEQGVTYNFSESGVHPMTLGGLLEMAGTGTQALSDVLLDYPEVRGTERLRNRIAALWRRHEYATISATMLGNTLGEIALDPAVRPKLTARARRLIDTGFARLNALVQELLEG